MLSVSQVYGIDIPWKAKHRRTILSCDTTVFFFLKDLGRAQLGSSDWRSFMQLSSDSGWSCGSLELVRYLSLHLHVVSGCFHVVSLSRATLGLFIAWQPQGTWTDHVVAKGCIAFPDLASEIKQHHFYLIILIRSKSQVCPDYRERVKSHLLIGEWKGSRRACGMGNIVVSTFEKHNLPHTPVKRQGAPG